MKLAALGAALVLTGCANMAPQYTEYARAAAEITKAQARPLLLIEAVPGQPITINAAKVEVNAPSGGLASVGLQAPEDPSKTWAPVVGQALGVAGTILGIQSAGRYAVAVGRVVQDTASAGYSALGASGAATASVATAGLSAVQGTAQGGYNAIQGVADSGLSATRAVAERGYETAEYGIAGIANTAGTGLQITRDVATNAMNTYRAATDAAFNLGATAIGTTGTVATTGIGAIIGAHNNLINTAISSGGMCPPQTVCIPR